jgi:hypothetical protein
LPARFVTTSLLSGTLLLSTFFKLSDYFPLRWYVAGGLILQQSTVLRTSMQQNAVVCQEGFL